MNLTQLKEIAWWDTIKKQSRTDNKVQPNPTTPRKRALKYTPPATKNAEIQHGGVPTEPSEQVKRKPTPIEIAKAILGYVKKHPESRKDIVLIVQNEYFAKKEQLSLKEVLDNQNQQNFQSTIDPKVLEKLKKLVTSLPFELLKELLVAL